MKLLCNYKKNPIGVIEEKIFLQVLLEGVEKYSCIEFCFSTTEEKAKRDENDLGVVKSKSYIFCYEKEIKPFERVFWRAKVFTDKKVKISEINYFEKGIDLKDIKAKWIESPFGSLQVNECKKIFKLETMPNKARLMVVGLGFFDAKVNNEKLDDYYYKPLLTDFDVRKNLNNLAYNEDNFNNGNKKISLYTYDIKEFLQIGENSLSVLLGNGYYNNTEKDFVDPSFTYGTPKLIFQIRLFYDGYYEDVISDEKSLFREIGKCSNMFAGDFFDFTYEKEDYQPALLSNSPQAKFITPAIEGDVVYKRYSAVSVKKCSGGYVYDFGYNHSGMISAKIKGEKGLKIKVKYFEVIDEDGEPNYDTCKWDAYDKNKVIVSSIYQSDTIICSGEEDQVFPLFSFKCYRYAKFECEKDFEIISIESLFICNAPEQNGDFVCGNDIFNRVVENFVRTQLSNYHCGTPLDCPHREKLPYTGDGQVCAETNFYLFDSASFYRKWLDDIRDSQGNNGIIPYSAPYIGGGGGYWYSNSIAFLSSDMYKYIGDKQILIENVDACLKLIDYYKNNLDERGVVSKIEFDWVLSDWATPEFTIFNVEFMSTLCFYVLIQKTQWILKQCGKKSQSNELNHLKNYVKRSINKVFFDKVNVKYCSGVQGEDLIPLICKIVPKKYEDQLKRKLLDKYKEGKHDLGFICFPLLIEYLCEIGQSQIAYKILNYKGYPSFYQLLQGETTLCETWSKHWNDYASSADGMITAGGGDVSHCHPMYGAIVKSFFKHVAGMDLSNLYKKKIIINPKFIKQINFAKSAKQTDYGKVSVEYENKEYFSMKVTIPYGLKAQVKLADMGNNLEVCSEKSQKTYYSENGKYMFNLNFGEWIIKSKKMNVGDENGKKE